VHVRFVVVVVGVVRVRLFEREVTVNANEMRNVTSGDVRIEADVPGGAAR
jgi:hypothetical protein